MILEAKVKRATGGCVHRDATIVGGKLVDGPVMPPPARVRIEPEKGGSSFFLLYFDEAGRVMNDGWHQTLEEAKRQAKFEFEIEEDDWTEKRD